MVALAGKELPKADLGGGKHAVSSLTDHDAVRNTSLAAEPADTGSNVLVASRIPDRIHTAATGSVGVLPWTCT